jgi:hypothetical protein
MCAGRWPSRVPKVPFGRDRERDRSGGLGRATPRYSASFPDTSGPTPIPLEVWVDAAWGGAACHLDWRLVRRAVAIA